jgi:hypothetical protein
VAPLKLDHAIDELVLDVGVIEVTSPNLIVNSERQPGPRLIWCLPIGQQKGHRINQIRQSGGLGGFSDLGTLHRHGSIANDCGEWDRSSQPESSGCWSGQFGENSMILAARSKHEFHWSAPHSLGVGVL